MRPRSFYIGFPPALVKVERKGIEYGIGMIPLGGLVRIPGMHRPGRPRPARVRRPGRARGTEPRSVRGRRPARSRRGGLRRSAARTTRSSTVTWTRRSLRRVRGARRERGLRDVEEGTAPDAYWRARDVEAGRGHRRGAAGEHPRRVSHPVRRLRRQRRAVATPDVDRRGRGVGDARRRRRPAGRRPDRRRQRSADPHVLRRSRVRSGRAMEARSRSPCAATDAG